MYICINNYFFQLNKYKIIFNQKNVKIFVKFSISNFKNEANILKNIKSFHTLNMFLDSLLSFFYIILFY